MNGIGPDETVLFDFRTEPFARSFVTARPIPPVAFESMRTSDTVLPMCSISSSICIKKQFESDGRVVPAPMFVDPAERYSSRDILS